MDEFSDGTPTQTYTNGFYCDEAKVKFIYNKSSEDKDTKLQKIIKEPTLEPDNVFVTERTGAKSGALYLKNQEYYFTYYFALLAMFSNNLYYLFIILVDL